MKFFDHSQEINNEHLALDCLWKNYETTISFNNNIDTKCGALLAGMIAVFAIVSDDIAKTLSAYKCNRINIAVVVSLLIMFVISAISLVLAIFTRNYTLPFSDINKNELNKPEREFTWNYMEDVRKSTDKVIALVIKKSRYFQQSLICFAVVIMLSIVLKIT